ncbi:MAG TPA: tetratricopeptide repeat protein, partial [Gemmatimonadaceae bacterium]|nr:tetratricopeptide repeat protein [Gemmatimonadaceae bacterium]
MDGLGISPDESTLERASLFADLKPIERSTASASTDLLLLEAIAGVERSSGPDSVQLLPGLASLAAARISRGELESAAPIVLRALDISEKHSGEDRPDLVPLLTDLTRLSLKQGLHALAEPLLLRLLDMKRHKGEDHPEVATVLASLATVRQTQGHHESAEQLWRRVLDIRERTLAPNHFAVATALERLADSCAARGKNAEALELFQRAYGMRERTLGPGHASLRVSRERIADLQLQASEDFGDLGEIAGPAMSSGIIYAAPAPVPMPASLPSSPQFPIATYKKPSPPLPFNPVPSALAAAPSSSLADRERPLPTFSADPVQSPYRDLLLSIEKDLEDEDDSPKGPSRLAAMATSLMAMVSERRRPVAVGVGAVVFLLLALAADSRAGTDMEPVSGDARAVTPTGAPTNAPVSATALSIPVRNVSKPASETVRAALSSFISSRSKGSEAKTERKSEERAPVPAKVALPKVSQNILAGAESVARSIN